MKKEEFLKELRYQLRYLNKDIIEEEIKSYNNLESYNQLPYEIANKIYEKRGINIKVTKKANFFNSINIIINNFKRKDKKIILNTLSFLLYLFILIILIKIPFIYVRDITSTIFNNIISNKIINTIWNLLFEFLYAITAIITFIKLINIRAQEYENIEK